MKTLMLIALEEDEIGQALYEQIGRLYPEAKGGHYFGGQGLDWEDPRTQSVLNALKQDGFQPATGLGPEKPGEFSMDLTRIYDVKDLDEADYLLPLPGRTFDDTARSPAGGLVLGVNRHSASINFGSSWHGLIVSDDFKRLGEQAGLKRLVYRKVELVKPKTGTPRGPYWELTSDLTLPPLAPQMSLVTDAGEVFRGDYKEGCLLREGLTVPSVLYRPPELHFTASAMESLPDFDLALTRETFGGSGNLYRAHVCSRNFRNFCRASRYRADWIPVRRDKV